MKSAAAVLRADSPAFRIPETSNTPLRGDYSGIRNDYTIPQHWDRYTAAEHVLWRELYRRSLATLPGYACQEFMDGLAKMNVAHGIPSLERVNEWLSGVTGWTLVAVPGLIPDVAFFDHLAHRRFPVSVWIRKREEMDYLVEPDIFHDFFGHVPLLANPVFADYMQAYGRKGPEAIAHDAVRYLSRLYWYMVEFGLIRTPQGLRAYGAGMLSSRSETVYSIDDARPNRIAFDLKRVMRTHYKIDTFQETYFVLDSYEQLFEATNQSFAPIYAELKAMEDIPASAVMPRGPLDPCA